MKVVLFCGGMGMRLRDYSDTVPKPMVCVGHRPILWNVMKYYAHYGHTEFILCLGYRGDTIKNYFLNYTECLSNDFTISNGGKDIHLYNNDISDWKITFADTGMTSNIGQRLKAVQKYLGDDEVFLANYSDGLTDFHLPNMLDFFNTSDKTACFLSVRPNQSFHIVNVNDDGVVNSITGLERSDIWVNGGYFILRRDIFDFIRDGDELVHEPFRRLIDRNALLTYRYDGFWLSMDTFKDKQHLDDLYNQGNTPWEVWTKTDNKRDFLE
jgi:glucose-1-phosphate cytidylyltransferase